MLTIDNAFVESFIAKFVENLMHGHQALSRSSCRESSACHEKGTGFNDNTNNYASGLYFFFSCKLMSKIQYVCFFSLGYYAD